MDFLSDYIKPFAHGLIAGVALTIGVISIYWHG